MLWEIQSKQQVFLLFLMKKNSSYTFQAGKTQTQRSCIQIKIFPQFNVLEMLLHDFFIFFIFFILGFI